MPHILLISSDKPEPIRFYREWKAHHALRLSVLARRQYVSLYAEVADAVYPVEDISDLTQVRATMLDVLHEQPVDYIVTPTEKSVLTGGFLRSFYAIPGPSFETSLFTTNKLAMKTRLRQAGIPVADFMRLDRLEDLTHAGERLGWPLILKPSVGSGTLDTFRVDSAMAGRELLAAGRLASLTKLTVPILAERCVEMEEYHCDALFLENRLHFASVSKYFSPPLKAKGRLLGSYIIPEEDPVRVQICTLLEAVASAFGITEGPAHLEVYRTASGELLVGEIALRLGGGGICGAIGHQYGVSMWDTSLRIAMHEDPGLKPVRSEGIVGWCGLPCRNGRIRAFTPMEELEAIPRVLGVQQHYQRGDLIKAKEVSTFHFATVYFRVDREEELARTLAEVNERFHLQMEDESGQLI